MASNIGRTVGLPFIDGFVDRVSDGTGALFSPLATPTVRIGVTGLSRSGKTVFITSLISNLLNYDRLPKLAVARDLRVEAAVLDDHPDGVLPRFRYEGHLDGLLASPPEWPQSTDRISQIRVKLRYRSERLMKRATGSTATLNIDLIDYPGEWLLDLPLMNMNYGDWSNQVVAAAKQGSRQQLSKVWTRELDNTSPDAAMDERTARRIHEGYCAYLKSCKRDDSALSLLQPGRFLRPGDLADSPALTFSPLPIHFADAPGKSLYREMDRRFELYKSKVVEPFFRDHFSKLDRQIVLLDLLGAAAAGADSLRELGKAMTLVQDCLRPGTSSWLGQIFFGRRIDKVLFAATKADHLPSDQHEALAKLTEELMSRSDNRFNFAGADSKTLAVAGLRSTKEGLVEQKNGPARRCILGTPLGADTQKAFYPGALPATIRELAASPQDAFGNLWFEPPTDLGGPNSGLPHSRLDQALEFLIGDLVA